MGWLVVCVIVFLWCIRFIVVCMSVMCENVCGKLLMSCLVIGLYFLVSSLRLFDSVSRWLKS